MKKPGARSEIAFVAAAAAAAARAGAARKIETRRGKAQKIWRSARRCSEGVTCATHAVARSGLRVLLQRVYNNIRACGGCGRGVRIGIRERTYVRTYVRASVASSARDRREKYASPRRNAVYNTSRRARFRYSARLEARRGEVRRGERRAWCGAAGWASPVM